MADWTLRERKEGIRAEWNGRKLTSLCGHENAKSVYIVKYSGSDTGLLHLMCSQCYRQKIWLALRVTHVVDRNTGEEYK